jgi:ribosomal protein L12E/L44/L45/RPP1/RPP2
MSVTDLVYRLVGNAGPLASELRSAERDVQRFQRRATSDMAKVGKAFAALGAAATTAFAVMVKGSIDTADQMQKMSDRVGIAIEDLSALSFVAEQSGTSIEALERPLATFASALASSGADSDKFTQSLRKIGVETRSASGELRPTIEVFKDISEQFSQLETGAQKTALAADIFGAKYGPQLLPLLNQGKDGIQALTQQAESLGLVIDEKTGRASERFNDNLNVLRRTFTGVANQVASQLLPVLVRYTNTAVDAANDSSLAASRVEAISNAFKVLLSLLDLVIAGFKVFGNAAGAAAAIILESLRGNFGAARNIASQFFTDFDNIATSVGDSWASIWTDTPEVERAARQQGEVVGSLFTDGVVERTRERVPSALEDAIKAANTAILKATEDAARAQERLFAQLESRAERVFLSTRTAQEQYNIAVAELRQLLDANLISQETYNRALNQAAQSLNKATESSDNFGESVEETNDRMNSFAARGADSLFAAFEDYFFNPMDRSLGDLLLNFGRTLARMASEAARQRIIQQLFGAAGATATASAGGGGGVVSAIGAGLGAAFGGRSQALDMGSGVELATRSAALTEQTFSVTNVNVVDPSMVQQMLMTPEGQRAVLNVMRANREVIL